MAAVVLFLTQQVAWVRYRRASGRSARRAGAGR